MAPTDLLVHKRSRYNITVVEGVDQYLRRANAQRSKAEQAYLKGMLKGFVGLYENEPAANIHP